MKLVLYYAPMTCALVPYVTLTEVGAEFDVRPLNTRANQHKTPEFLALNPKHKVPVLLIDGEPLTENVAIQIWIARAFPAAKLLPQDPGAEIRAISLMAWFASTIHPHLTPNARPGRGHQHHVHHLPRQLPGHRREGPGAPRGPQPGLREPAELRLVHPGTMGGHPATAPGLRRPLRRPHGIGEALRLAFPHRGQEDDL